MRTTITLDPDVALHVQRVMTQRRIGFKRAVNDLIRAGQGADIPAPADISWPTYPSGGVHVDLTHATRLAAAMDDEATIRELVAGR